MEKNELALLSEISIEGLGREIAAMSDPKALALLRGIAHAFIKQEFPNNRSMRHCHAHGISMAVNMRLIECISLLESVVAGRVDAGGDHKLAFEEQVFAGAPSDQKPISEQQLN